MSNQLKNMNELYEGVKKELDEMIVTLRSKIQKVLEGQDLIFTRKEHSNFYTIIYNLVLDGDRYNSPQGQKLYELYQSYQQGFLRKSAEIVKEKNDKEKKLFEEFLYQDQLFTYHSKILNKYFEYLNRSVVEIHSTGKYCLLKDQARKQFYQYLYLPFHSQLFEQLKYKLNQDRQQKDKETQKQLQQIFQIITNMDSIDSRNLDQSIQNQKIFQSIYSESIQFYQSQYNKFKQTTYIEQLEQLVQFKAEELDRIKTIFLCEDTLTQNKLIDHFNEQIIIQYANEMSEEQNNSLQFIIKSSLEIQEQNQMSQFLPFQELIKFLNGLRIKKEIQEKGKPTHIQFDNVAKKFQQIIYQNGIEIINEKKNGLQFTKNEKEQLIKQQNNLLNELIKLQQKYKKLIETEAQDNIILTQSLRTSIEDITSEDQKYLMDAFLQKLNDYFGFGVDNQDDLTNIIQLLDSFQAKDVFLKNYQIQLAHRLLTLFNLKNMEKEKRIIDQLKKICGPENTQPLEFILKEFESQQIEIAIGEINVKPKILCKEYWPEFNPKFTIQLQQFDELKEAFKIRYNDLQSLNQVRDLTWQDQLSMVELAFTTNKQYRMTISLLGAALLIKLDQNGNQLVIDEIQNMFGINDSRYLTNQQKLLEKFNLVISDGQCLRFNENFSFNKTHFLVGLVVEKIVEYQQSDMYQDRKIAIEAAIVRIMKAKKKQSYLQIVSQVKEQLKLFRPKDYDIKVIVEHLMDKAYIKRDQNNPNEFIYIS